MLLNINETRGPTDWCSATHWLLLSEVIGLWDAESIIFNRGRSVASWTFTGRVFHHVQRPLNGHLPSYVLILSHNAIIRHLIIRFNTMCMYVTVARCLVTFILLFYMSYNCKYFETG